MEIPNKIRNLSMFMILSLSNSIFETVPNHQVWGLPNHTGKKLVRFGPEKQSGISNNPKTLILNQYCTTRFRLGSARFWCGLGQTTQPWKRGGFFSHFDQGWYIYRYGIVRYHIKPATDRYRSQYRFSDPCFSY